MVQESELWMSDDAVCVTCDVAFEPHPDLPKEIRNMIMCKPCGDYAWDKLRAYANGKIPVEALKDVRIPKREMLRPSTVDLFARNYTRLTGKKMFVKWFTENTIGPEKFPDKPAVMTFLDWVRSAYNQQRKTKPMGAKPKGFTAKLEDVATVTVETPPVPPQPEPQPEPQSDTSAVEAAPQTSDESAPVSEKEKKSRRRKRSATEDAPAVPGAEVEISRQTPAKAASKKSKTDAEKLKDKIQKDQERLKARIDKDKEKLHR
ncbi:MAG: hypothetical protein ACE5EW_08170 [Thermoplasmata archaeon]